MRFSEEPSQKNGKEGSGDTLWQSPEEAGKAPALPTEISGGYSPRVQGNCPEYGYRYDRPLPSERNKKQLRHTSYSKGSSNPYVSFPLFLLLPVSSCFFPFLPISLYFFLLLLPTSYCAETIRCINPSARRVTSPTFSLGIER